MSATNEFIRGLLLEVPELQELYDEHIRDNDELLPHVFMGDVTRFVVELHADSLEGGAAANVLRHILIRILDLLEAAMRSGDEDVKELVAVSFLENLDQNDENYTSLKSLFGDTLLEQLKMFED